MFLLLRNHSQKSLLMGVETIEIIVELAIAVSCGLLAGRRLGLGAPILEKWFLGGTIRSQLQSVLVPSLLVGILIAPISFLPSLSVFHPNRQLAHHEAERISESADRSKLNATVEQFSGRPLTLTSLTVLYLNDAIRGELISRLFLLSTIALLVHDSFWLVLARTLLGTVPGAVGFGWLYACGIESAIFSAFVASVVSRLLFLLVVMRLV
jgi:hypothetical protein